MYIGIFFLFLILVSVGCVDNSDTTDSQKDSPSSFDPYEKIVGVWMSQGSNDNKTFAIIYDFFSNLSFFTGLFDVNTSSYVSSQWGMYELDNETVFFYGADGNNITSSLNYSFSTDFNTLVLFFDDDKYLTLSKIEQG